MMHRELFITSVSSLGYAIYSLVKYKHIKVKELLIYCSVLFLLLFSTGKLLSQVDDYVPEKYRYVLNQDEIDIYRRISNDCFNKSYDLMQTSYQICVCQCNDNGMKLACVAINSALASLAAGANVATVYATLIGLVGAYLADVWENYQFLELNFVKSQVYYEMGVFYRSVITHAEVQ